MATEISQVQFLIHIMFWTILAIMLVVLYSLKGIKRTQTYIENIDLNMERLVLEILRDEERILEDLEGGNRGNFVRKSSVKKKLKKKR